MARIRAQIDRDGVVIYGFRHDDYLPEGGRQTKSGVSIVATLQHVFNRRVGDTFIFTLQYGHDIAMSINTADCNDRQCTPLLEKIYTSAIFLMSKKSLDAFDELLG